MHFTLKETWKRSLSLLLFEKKTTENGHFVCGLRVMGLRRKANLCTMYITPFLQRSAAGGGVVEVWHSHNNWAMKVPHNSRGFPYTVYRILM